MISPRTPFSPNPTQVDKQHGISFFFFPFSLILLLDGLPGLSSFAGVLLFFLLSLTFVFSADPRFGGAC